MDEAPDRRNFEITVWSMFLSTFCLYAYWYIHYYRLDYSRDTSFLGFWNTNTVLNEASRVHVAFGLAAGFLLTLNSTVCSCLALLLVFGYTIRNLKHLGDFQWTFRNQNLKPPSAWRSSMTRQQLQLHAGIGLGGLITRILLRGSISNLSMWSVRLVVLFSVCIGVKQLSLPSIKREDKERFLTYPSSYSRKRRSRVS